MEGQSFRTGVFRIFLVVFSVVADINANRCYPCDVANSRYTEYLDNCDHLITKESVLFSIKALNHTFTLFRNLAENEINPVNYEYISSTCVQNPVSAKVKKRLPKRYKDRFVHETFAKLSYAYDVMENVLEKSAADSWNRAVKNELTIVMCNMVKVNRKIHCRKNKNKPSRRLIGFNKTGVCEKRDLFQNASTPSELVVCSLESLKHVQRIIADTMGFWNSCVQESKNGKLVLKRRCRKSKRCKKGRSKTKNQRRRCQRRRKNGKKQKKMAKKSKLFS